MTKKRSILALLLISMLLTSALTIGANDDNKGFDKQILTDELVLIMESCNDDELIPIDIWIEEIDTEKVEKLVKDKVGIDRMDIRRAYVRENLDNSEYQEIIPEAIIEEYIYYQRKYYAEMQLEENNKYVERWKKSKNSRNFNKSIEDDTIFISKFSPVIGTELTKSEIKAMSKEKGVQTIDYVPEIEIENHANISIPTIQADRTRDTKVGNTSGLTGKGVNIGMIEQGLPRISSTYFTTANIHHDPSAKQSSYSLVIDHATLVAAIMVGKRVSQGGNTYTVEGIAPNAKLFATNYDYTTDFNALTLQWRKKLNGY